MKVYLASWFASKTKMRDKAEELRGLGIEVTSRWLKEKIGGQTQVAEVSDSYLRTTAIVDIEDILKADVVVLMSPSKKDLKKVPKPSWSRGGRVFESGLQYGLMLAAFLSSGSTHRRLIICGPKENVFHWLDTEQTDFPNIEHVSSWKSLVRYLSD